ncbi:MAG: alpha-L-rhamnosidase N-terminal domain-containing protein [Tepidisphaerales bacterium]
MPTDPKNLPRRQLFKTAAFAGTTLLAPGANAAENQAPFFTPVDPQKLTEHAGAAAGLPDLRPARWLWYPSTRCLPSTVVLFRRTLELPAKPRRAAGWILGSSRYHLFANGERIQFGPAPSDPRYEEIDPVDLTAALHAGKNTLGAQVLYYGHGDGTWPIGKPGFLFWLEIEHADGRKETLVTDHAWRVHLCRAWRPGQYKRWYLRAFQEDFDARLYPYGWTGNEFPENADWIAPMQIPGEANRPPLATGYYEYVLDIGAGSAELRPRSIPMLRETLVPVKGLAESMFIEWTRPAEEYFECQPPDCFKADRTAAAKPAGGTWEVELDGKRAAALTFELAEQIVGWPYFTIEAPAGTIVELMVHEAHAPGGPALLNTHFNAWTRFVCREGVNRFETFDFESPRWMQLHIRGAKGRVVVRDVGVRRRMFPWPNQPQVKCSDPAIQTTLDASINTLNNCAQETLVDGMGRERQQYSGDGGHQLHGVVYAFGETRLPGRFIRTFSQGMTLDGYFLDCWPAYDRLARLMERQVGLTMWGPLLDHGIGFNFDCYYYHLYSGDLRPLTEAYPRLLRFAQYLANMRREDGLLPVENIGVPAVWMDHQAYRNQRDKQCAFNLYAAAMLENALPAIARAFGDAANEQSARKLGAGLREATVHKFWSDGLGLFINNPWDAKGSPRTCDRSLATAVLFDQCPGGKSDKVIQTLVEAPATMGQSYPCNAGWRYWALAKAGRVDVVLKALRQRWATMGSVRLNNTLQEDWAAQPDSGAQWSHCAVVPLYFMYMSVAGIRPLAPGFARCEIRPQLADLESLELRVPTPRGVIEFSGRGKAGDRTLGLRLPEGVEGELVLDPREKPQLEAIGNGRYKLPRGQEVVVRCTVPAG